MNDYKSKYDFSLKRIKVKDELIQSFREQEKEFVIRQSSLEIEKKALEDKLKQLLTENNGHKISMVKLKEKNGPLHNQINVLKTKLKKLEDESNEWLNIMTGFWKFRTYKQWLKMRKEIKEQLWDKLDLDAKPSPSEGEIK